MDNDDAAEVRTRVAVIQMAVPAYREVFFRHLRSRLPNLMLAAGEIYYDETIRTGDRGGLLTCMLRNRFLLRRRLAYQQGYRRALQGSDVWVLELNPRTVSTWLALVEGRFRRRRVLLWGHFRGRAIGASGPGFGRALQVRLADGVIAYTVGDAEAFRRRFPKSRVGIAPNATELAADIGVRTTGPRSDFVYVGRLVRDKRVDVIIAGFASARAASLLPDHARLVVVGAGPEQGALKDLATSMGSSSAVAFVDEVFGSSSLDSIYSTAVAGVCGGYVGLNITQSLSRGVPFVYPSRAAHSPEVSLAVNGVNAFAFGSDSPDRVAAALAAVWDAEYTGRVDHQAIQAATLSVYAVERMVDGFMGAVAGLSPQPMTST